MGRSDLFCFLYCVNCRKLLVSCSKTTNRAIFLLFFTSLFDKFYYLCTANQITIINFKPINNEEFNFSSTSLCRRGNANDGAEEQQGVEQWLSIYSSTIHQC